MKKLFIIDAMNLFYRSHYGVQARLTTSAGVPTSAVFGATVAVLRLINEQRPDYLVVATDSQTKTFRHEMFADYKGTRKPMPDDLKAQMANYYRMFEALGVKVLRVPGMEADDLIGSVAAQFTDVHCYIVSNDKDFSALVNHRVSLFVSKNGSEPAIQGADYVQEKFGVPPTQIVDLLAIMGDASDNVPGVKGIGSVGATKLIKSFGSLEGVYERLGEVGGTMMHKLARSKEEAFLSKKLVTIKTDCNLGLSLDDLLFDRAGMHKNVDFIMFLEEMEFSSLAGEFKSISALESNYDGLF